MTFNDNFSTPLNTLGMGMATGTDPIININKLNAKKTRKLSLKKYINERKQISNQNVVRNTPDCVHYNGFHNYWTDRSARGFIYNKDTNQVIFTEPGRAHEDIFDFPKFLLDMIGLGDMSIEQIKFSEWENYNKAELPEAINKWYANNKEYIDKFLLGRIWYVDPLSKNSDKLQDLLFGTQSERKRLNSKPKTFISWWSELTPQEFNKFNKNVVKQFNKNFSTNITTFYAVDNNGNIIKMSDNSEVNIKSRSEESTKEIETISAIHNGTQEAKRKFFADYRNLKDKKFAKKWLSDKDNKSGTEAEYRWRHIIGDSLNY